jgi:D-glycerate 3-kinase
MNALEALIRAHALPEPYRAMIQAVHRPVAAHVAARRRALGRPIVVGLCGSQGSGKSTMAAFLAALLEEEGLTSAVLSLDDLYLTHAQRQRLGDEVHPLLRTRGPPGTHDPGLGLALLDVLTFGGAAEVALPRFDKAEDDRAAASTWPRVQAPVDVVLFEGWCVGAIPQDAAALAQPVNELERDEDAHGVWRRYVNDQLKGDYAALFGRIDVLALLQAPGFEAVYDWRLLQEQKLAERLARDGLAGRRVMSPDQIRRFLMLYQRLTQHILAEMAARADIVMPLTADHRIAGMVLR